MQIAARTSALIGTLATAGMSAKARTQNQRREKSSSRKSPSWHASNIKRTVAQVQILARTRMPATTRCKFHQGRSATLQDASTSKDTSCYSRDAKSFDVASCWRYCCCLRRHCRCLRRHCCCLRRHCCCLHPNCGRYSCYCWRPFSSLHNTRIVSCNLSYFHYVLKKI